MQKSSVLGLIASVFLSASALPALAADLPSKSVAPVFTQPDPGFEVTLGAGPNVLNRFPGSREITVLPTFHLGYRKAGEPEAFYTPDDSFDIAIYENPFFRIGPAANFINNRGSCCGFQGLHTIGSTAEVGGFAEVYLMPRHIRVRGEILQGVTGSKGLVGNLGADGIQRFGAFEFSLGPRIGFGNSRYANQYFGVSTYEASQNPLLTPYNARGGLTSVGGLGTVRYDLNRQYSVLLFGGYSRLVDSVGQSPIATRIGDRNQFTAGATLNYTFAFRGFGILGY